MDIFANIISAFIGVSLVVTAMFIVIKRETFFPSGFILLIFGFLFGCLPFADNVAMSFGGDDGLQIQYETRLAKIQEATQLTAAANNILARCIERLYKHPQLWNVVRDDPELVKLLHDSLTRSQKASTLMEEIENESET